MDIITTTPPFHVSVVCVYLGFNGESFQALIGDRSFEKEDGTVARRFGLPGGIVGADEDLDAAAHRVFKTHAKNMEPNLKQFQVFGAADRCKKNIAWDAFSKNVGGTFPDRLLCVAYVATTRILADMEFESGNVRSKWHPCDALPALSFDHADIVSEAILSLKRRLKAAPDFVYDLLNTEFTAAELRRLIEAIVGKKLDIRNFYKKLEARPYLVPTNKKQVNVAHRAARFYRFDRKIYKKRFEDAY